MKRDVMKMNNHDAAADEAMMVHDTDMSMSRSLIRFDLCASY